VHLPLRGSSSSLPTDPADGVLRNVNEPVVARKSAAEINVQLSQLSVKVLLISGKFNWLENILLGTGTEYRSQKNSKIPIRIQSSSRECCHPSIDDVQYDLVHMARQETALPE
jgi:hypothetical protein